MAYVDIVGSQNLYLNSEAADSWTKSHMSVVNNAVESPDGEITADKVIPSTTNGNHFVYQNGLTLTAPQTFSVFAKSAGYNFIKLYMSGSTVCSANFNLSTGVVGTTGGTGFGSARIQNVGDGWYRCEVTITANITSAQTSGGIYVTSVDGGVSPYSEAGDGTSGAYIWGAQLESGTGSSTYIKTTNAARSFTGSNGHWQYENTATVSNTYPDSADGANTTVVAGVKSYNKPDGGTVKTYLRTRKKGQINKALYSENFDNAWWKLTVVTLTANAGVAPDGTNTAYKVTPTTASRTDQRLYRQYWNSINHTASIFAKSAGYDYINITFQSGADTTQGVQFNLATGVVVTSQHATGKIYDAGNGWYRCSVIPTTNTQSSHAMFHPSNGSTPDQDFFRPTAWAGDGTSGVLMWGAQISEGLIVTPYIKTTNAVSTTIERGEVSKTYFDLQG